MENSRGFNQLVQLSREPIVFPNTNVVSITNTPFQPPFCNSPFEHQILGQVKDGFDPSLNSEVHEISVSEVPRSCETTIILQSCLASRAILNFAKSHTLVYFKCTKGRPGASSESLKLLTESGGEWRAMENRFIA
ncbi:hypothetical protein V6N13_050362 [Hibiscus sabdariffa]